MKIYKLAQAGDYIDLEIVIDENGIPVITVINGPGVKCGDFSSEGVISKIFTSEGAEGFGAPFMEATDGGKTAEFFEEAELQRPEEVVIDEAPIVPIRGPQTQQKQELEY